MVKALLTGSFDPFTLGHEQLVKSVLKIVDTLDIVLALNSSKKSVFPIQNRIECIKYLYDNDSRITVCSHSGLIAKYCIDNNIDIIVRGVRSNYDLEYEKNMATMNEKMCGVETIFFPAKQHLQHISSTIVRDILLNGGSINELVPEKVSDFLSNMEICYE